jgi:actin-related protein
VHTEGHQDDDDCDDEEDKEEEGEIAMKMAELQVEIYGIRVKSDECADEVRTSRICMGKRFALINEAAFRTSRNCCRLTLFHFRSLFISSVFFPFV